MKGKVAKIVTAVAVVSLVCLGVSYMGDIKGDKTTKVVKSESTNYAEGIVTYEISDEARGEIKKLVAETVEGMGVSLTNDQIEELTSQVTKEVKLRIEEQYEADINAAVRELGSGTVTDDDIDNLRADIEEAIKRETSKTPSVLYGELKENLRIDETIGDYLEDQGYLSTDNISSYTSSKEFKDNVDARIAKAMQQNKTETSADLSKLSDQVAGDLKKSVDGLKNDISSLETQQANDKRSLEQSIRSNASSIAALESSSLATSTFESFYSQYQIDKQYLDDWKSQTSSDISTLSDTVSSNDQANQQRFLQIESDASDLEERVGQVETAVGNIEVYVSDDGQLHYVDGTGADTALNFSSNPKIGSINQRSSRPNSNYDYNETWTISQDNTGVKYTVSLSNDNGCHGWSCGVYKKDGTCIASGGRSITWQGTLNKGDYVRWKQTGGHASTDYYGSASLIEVVFEK